MQELPAILVLQNLQECSLEREMCTRDLRGRKLYLWISRRGALLCGSEVVRVSHSYQRDN